VRRLLKLGGDHELERAPEVPRHPPRLSPAPKLDTRFSRGLVRRKPARTTPATLRFPEQALKVPLASLSPLRGEEGIPSGINQSARAPVCSGSTARNRPARRKRSCNLSAMTFSSASCEARECGAGSRALGSADSVVRLRHHFSAQHSSLLALSLRGLQEANRARTPPKLAVASGGTFVHPFRFIASKFVTCATRGQGCRL
jgi:hypothetical protein